MRFFAVLFSLLYYIKSKDIFKLKYNYYFMLLDEDFCDIVNKNCIL